MQSVHLTAVARCLGPAVRFESKTSPTGQVPSGMPPTAKGFNSSAALSMGAKHVLTCTHRVYYTENLCC